MDTVLASPESGTHPPRRKRKLTRILVALVLAMAIAIGLIVVWTMRPLAYGSGSTGSTGSAVSKLVATQTLGNEYQFFFTPNAEFGYGFTLTNRGPLPIRITGFQPRPLREFGSSDLRVLRNEFRFDFEHTDEFTPFVLGRKSSRTFIVKYRFAGCEHALQDGNGIGWTYETFHFRVAGIRRTMEVTLPFGVAILGRAGVCGQ